MSEMGAAAFKAHCLQVMEKVRRTRRPVVITKRGVPIVKVVPADPRQPFKLGALAGRFSSTGDIVSSPLSDEEWDAIHQRNDEQWDRWVKEEPAGPKRPRRTRKGR